MVTDELVAITEAVIGTVEMAGGEIAAAPGSRFTGRAREIVVELGADFAVAAIRAATEKKGIKVSIVNKLIAVS